MPKTTHTLTNGSGRVPPARVEIHKRRAFTVPDPDAAMAALNLPPEPTLAQWEDFGRELVRFHRKVDTFYLWQLGRWWRSGDIQEGERKRLVESTGWNGPSFQRCMNVASVVASYGTDLPPREVSFTHYEAAVVRDPAERDALLERAEANRWSVARLRDAAEVEDLIADLPADEQDEMRSRFDIDGDDSEAIRAALLPPPTESGEDERPPRDINEDLSTEEEIEETEAEPCCEIRDPEEHAGSEATEADMAHHGTTAINLRSGERVDIIAPAPATDEDARSCAKQLDRTIAAAGRMNGALAGVLAPLARVIKTRRDRESMVRRIDIAIAQLERARKALS